MSPADLLGAALRLASYRGGTYASLADLLVRRRPGPPPTLATIPPGILPWPLVRDTAAGVSAHAILVGDALLTEAFACIVLPFAVLLFAVIARSLVRVSRS